MSAEQLEHTMTALQHDVRSFERSLATGLLRYKHSRIQRRATGYSDAASSRRVQLARTLSTVHDITTPDTVLTQASMGLLRANTARRPVPRQNSNADANADTSYTKADIVTTANRRRNGTTGNTVKGTQQAQTDTGTTVVTADVLIPLIIAGVLGAAGRSLVAPLERLKILQQTQQPNTGFDSLFQG